MDIHIVSFEFSKFHSDGWEHGSSGKVPAYLPSITVMCTAAHTFFPAFLTPRIVPGVELWDQRVKSSLSFLKHNAKIFPRKVFTGLH
jgi:hypothetical protein